MGYNFGLNSDYKKTLDEIIELVKTKSIYSGWWSNANNDTAYVYYDRSKTTKRTHKNPRSYDVQEINIHEFLQELNSEIDLKDRIKKIKKIRNQLIRRTIEIELPKGFMNVGVSTDNYLIADTNDSSNWDTLKFPLPEGKWVIKSNPTGKIVTLITKENKYNKQSIPI